MTIHRGVSLYSYQQTQYLGEIDLEGQIREVGRNLDGADGLEVIDEMSLTYPHVSDAFVDQWFGWMEQYGTKPVALDVGMDVLQYRDHVMSHEEVAERLRHDILLAKRLGFSRVRTLSVVPIDVLALALPFAEEHGIMLGKEIHQPMTLEGPVVQEILDLRERTGSTAVGVVPDFGIFQFRPSPVQLAQWERRGASKAASEAVVDLSVAFRTGDAPFERDSSGTAGNIRVDFATYFRTGESPAASKEMFDGVKAFVDERVADATGTDYALVAEALLFSDTSADTLGQLAKDGVVSHIHGKFNLMSETDQTGVYDEIAIDYDAPVAALRAADWDGYINTEYEGQRYLQDLERDQLMDEVDQVRRHQSMLRKLIDA